MIILIHIFTPTTSQPDFIVHSCSDTGNYTNNSTYKANLNSLLSSSSCSDTGFFNSSFGEEPNRVNLIALCRGDVAFENCQTCVKNSALKILEMCPNQKEAFGWYENCTLRYSNKSIFGVVDLNPTIALISPNNVSDLVRFNHTLRTLLSGWPTKQCSSISGTGSDLVQSRFATENAITPDFKTIHALVECTSDLNEPQCNDCLDYAARYIPECCNGKDGGRVLTPSCTLRFEIHRFYGCTVAPPILSPHES